MAYGASYEYTTAETTNKNMQLFCVGIGFGRHVEENTQVPSNWQEFLRVDENKSELFHLISDRIVDEDFSGLVIVTLDDEVLFVCPLRSCRADELYT